MFTSLIWMSRLFQTFVLEFRLSLLVLFMILFDFIFSIFVNISVSKFPTRVERLVICILLHLSAVMCRYCTLERSA